MTMTAPELRAEAPTSSEGLLLEHLHGARAGRALFADLNLALSSGELLWVRGANGAGKTSLLRMICGLLTPQHGRVLWRGEDVSRLREEYGRELVYLGHAAALKAELSALENLQVAAALGGLAIPTDAARHALADAGLAGREHAPVRTLSQGQRRRVALARLVLSSAVPLWVLDEPFTALDSAATAWLAALIGQHIARAGIVVLTSHQEVMLPHAVRQLTLAA